MKEFISKRIVEHLTKEQKLELVERFRNKFAKSENYAELEKELMLRLGL